MSINLAVNFSQTGAIAHRIRYARIDNVLTPVFSTIVPDVTTSPAVIATNIPNGQYEIRGLPIYGDGRICEETSEFTDPCPGLISINAYIDSSNIVVEYLAPFDAPKVRITVNYPNGGSTVANYVNDGNNIVIPLPNNFFGDFQVSGQSVCDESSGFYSAPSSIVVTTNSSENVTLTHNATGITITGVTGISGFILSQSLVAGNTDTGSHDAFFAPIIISFTGTPAFSENAILTKNGTTIQCVNIPNTNGGSFQFSAASFAANDQLGIEFNIGLCP